MLLVTVTIFLTTLLPILAVAVHLGNTGRVFLNRREIACIVALVGVFSLSVGLLTCPDEAVPVKAKDKVFSSSEDKWLRNVSTTDKIVKDILRKQGLVHNGEMYVGGAEVVVQHKAQDLTSAINNLREAAALRDELNTLEAENTARQRQIQLDTRLNQARSLNNRLFPDKD
jgi:hypothetical protein